MADKYLLTCMILDAYFQGKFYQKFISKVDSSFLYSVNSILKKICWEENTNLMLKVL